MGLFDWFSKNQPQTTVNNNGSNNGQNEIPEKVFIEKGEPPPALDSNGEAKGINAIYAFLQSDYEPKGYNDALVNPDQSNKADGIKLIKLKLKIIMDKEINSYEKSIKDLDYHIKTRSDAGLVDLVEELKTEKEKASKDIDKIKEIEAQMNTNSGLFEKVILSYEQGFKRGLAAITKSKFL
ncbi:MAG TPA: hypothetical protein VNJ29_01700 [Candidatus Nitrosotenuis sp.]|nr:hypothetical protein [Candidatus Nitrosotenuis sp.]